MKPRVPLPSPLDRRAFTSDEGRTAGLSRGRMRGADVRHPFRGIVAPRGTADDVVELYSALQRKLPSDSYAHGITAAMIMGVPLPRRHQQSLTVHIASPSGHRAVRGVGIRGHSVEAFDGSPREWNGLRVASPEQLWCELATVVSLGDLVAAGDYLIHWRHPITEVRRLEHAVHSFAGHRGVRKLRVALALLNDRAESPKESELRVILVQAGIPGVEVNLPITTSGGFSYRADLALPRRRTIIEYQGDHHRDPETFRKDMTRASRLEADGWRIVNVNADDLRDPDELLSRIRA